MKEILIFAGTTEGRKLAEYLLNAEKNVHICVATEYGEEVLLKHERLTIHQGRLDVTAMESLMGENDWEMIIDATHPYAVEVSKNIKTACEHTKQEYIRLLRAEEQMRNDFHVTYVDTLEEAAEFLNHTQGNLLLTTGSKELSKYIDLFSQKSHFFALFYHHAVREDSCVDS